MWSVPRAISRYGKDTSVTQVDTDSEASITAAIDLLRSLREGDEAEQRETGEYLVKSLDEDRPSYRKLFPSS